MARRSNRGRWMAAVLAIVVIIAGIAMSGPRPNPSMTNRFDAAAIGPDPDLYLEKAEAPFPDIRPGLAKEIVWADPAKKTRTPLAIVYVHGFSASKGEVRPLPDLVANALGANLFYTRLTGHAQTGDAMATATLDAWAGDMAEALAIGDRIGERTIVMAASTGATLTTWALADQQLSSSIAAVVFLAPNFALKPAGSSLLTAPWARRLAHLVLGERRSFEPANARQAELWTTEYPVDALLPMAALVKKVTALDLSAISKPALMIASPNDQVVDTSVTEKVVARWGGPAQLVDPGPVDDASSHIVAGDALSPSTTQAMAALIIDWLQKLP